MDKDRDLLNHTRYDYDLDKALSLRQYVNHKNTNYLNKRAAETNQPVS